MSFDITQCLQEEYDILRGQCAELCSSSPQRKRTAAATLLPLLTAHTLAEEEVLFSRALEFESLRPQALKALEEHEVTENELVRLWQSVDEEQFSARASVVCDLLCYQWRETEEKLLPALQAEITKEERQSMGVRYREIKERHRYTALLRMPERESPIENQAGRVGYLMAWLLGIPAWLLLMIFLIRG